MNPPDLDKLRRFSLTTALILITYVSAGVDVDTIHAVSILGLPLMIRRPNLIIIGLIIASLYGTARYWYYAFLHKPSPRKRRRRFLKNFTPSGQPDLYRGAVPMTTDEIAPLKRELPDIFPELPRVAPALTVGQPPKSGGSGVILFVPRRIRQAAWFEDLDYSAPIWLNLLALPLAILSAGGFLLHAR